MPTALSRHTRVGKGCGVQHVYDVIKKIVHGISRARVIKSKSRVLPTIQISKISLNLIFDQTMPQWIPKRYCDTSCGRLHFGSSKMFFKAFCPWAQYNLEI